jgi:hypothetical protein
MALFCRSIKPKSALLEFQSYLKPVFALLSGKPLLFMDKFGGLIDKRNSETLSELAL